MSELVHRFNRFNCLLDIADSRFAQGDLNGSAAMMQIAARCAWPGHAGLFASPRMERLLKNIGSKISLPRQAGGTIQRKRRVLHVLTYGKPVGGDTRCVCRWISEDCSSEHSVVITSQSYTANTYEIPISLRAEANRSGGSLFLLKNPPSRPISQAKELRALCQRYDFVILHLYPYDVVPTLALATGCEDVKVLLVNHSDHTFWVGSGVSQIVVNLRAQPRGFLSSRRGLNESQTFVLPIPLSSPQTRPNRSGARKKLGVADDTVVMLTIASPFKYNPRYGIDFLNFVLPVVVENKQTVLVVVGPDGSGPQWSNAVVAAQGRVIPMGTRYDTKWLYEAADIYLDSLPFSSITSLLEAGIHDVPLVGLSFKDSQLRLLGPGAPGLENTLQAVHDADEYRQLLTRLVTDPAHRREIGQATGQTIRSLHGGDGWKAKVQGLYSQAARCTISVLQCSSSEEHYEEGPLDEALVALYAAEAGVVMSGRLARTYLGPLPYRTRLKISKDMSNSALPISLIALLPPPFNAAIQSSGRYLNGRWHKTKSVLKKVVPWLRKLSKYASKLQ